MPRCGPRDKVPVGADVSIPRVISGLVGLALPSRCLACGDVVDTDHHFYADCWRGLTMIAPPWCATCNRPFEFDRGAAAICGECLATTPVHDGVREAAAYVAYGVTARNLVLRLKYGGHTAYAATAARPMSAGADLLVPVSVHRWRIWGQGLQPGGADRAGTGARERLAGRAVVLVDDVYTSGATTDACVRALKRGSAAWVTILCWWARVLDPDATD